MAEMKIVRDAIAQVPLDHAWDCISEGEHIGGWLSLGSADIELRAGGRLTLRYPGYDEPFVALIEQVQEPRALSFRWHAKHHEDSPEIRVDNSTLYTIELEPARRGTHVTIVESGFDRLAGTPAQVADAYDSNVEGREVNLASLVRYMEATAQ